MSQQNSNNKRKAVGLNDTEHKDKKDRQEEESATDTLFKLVTKNPQLAFELWSGIIKDLKNKEKIGYSDLVIQVLEHGHLPESFEMAQDLFRTFMNHGPSNMKMSNVFNTAVHDSHPSSFFYPYNSYLDRIEDDNYTGTLEQDWNLPCDDDDCPGERLDKLMHLDHDVDRKDPVQAEIYRSFNAPAEWESNEFDGKHWASLKRTDLIEQLISDPHHYHCFEDGMGMFNFQTIDFDEVKNYWAIPDGLKKRVDIFISNIELLGDQFPVLSLIYILASYFSEKLRNVLINRGVTPFQFKFVLCCDTYATAEIEFKDKCLSKFVTSYLKRHGEAFKLNYNLTKLPRELCILILKYSVPQELCARVLESVSN